LDSRSKKAPRQGTDPICGAKVVDSDAQHTAEYKRRRYVFCSARCKHEFERAAERIRVHQRARAGVLFTQDRIRWGLA
jgi:YHS domain-containing protein